MNSIKKSTMATSCIVGIAMALLSSEGAFAQDTGPQPTPSDAATYGINEAIVVTARRRSERLQDVPVAVTAFSTEKIARYSTDSIAQVAVQTPSLIVGTTSNLTGGVMNLRGVGSANGSPGIEQGVSLNIDGIVFSSATYLRLGLHDLDRIEVLKGPQTLFYGKNSPGGIISIVSANPGDELEAKIRTGYEFYDERKYLEAMVSTPLTASLGLRVDGYYAKQNGWLRNTAEPFAAIPQPNGAIVGPGPGTSQKTGPDNEEYFVRGTLVFEAPNGVFDANLKVAYGEQNQNNGISSRIQAANCVAGEPQLAIALGIPGAGNRQCKLDRYFNEPDPSPGIRALHPLLDNPDRFDNSYQFLTVLAANFHPSDNMTVSSVTGYAKSRETAPANYAYFGLSSVEAYLDLKLRQFSQELRLLTSFDGPANFLLGGYYQDAKYSNRGLTGLAEPFSRAFSGGFLTGNYLLFNNIQEQKTKAWSVFGQVILDLFPQVELTAGGRYSHERKRVSATTFPDGFVGNTTFDPIFDPSSASWRDFSPDVTLTYKPMPTLTLYGAFREGFKSGGFDVSGATTAFGRTTISNIKYDQETVRGFEAGAKGSFADRQVTYGLTLYRYKYKGLQVSTFDPRTLAYQVTNAGSSIVKGVELETEIRPSGIDGLSLRSAIAYNSAKFGNFLNGPCYTGQTIAAGCDMRAIRDASGNLVYLPAGPGVVGNVQNLTGKTLYRAPRWSGNAGATYEKEVSPGIMVSVSGDALYTGSYYSSLERLPTSYNKSAWRFNARLAVGADDGRWELALIGTNLTNELRQAHGFSGIATGGGTGTLNGFLPDTVATLTPWRTITLQATVKY